MPSARPTAEALPVARRFAVRPADDGPPQGQYEHDGEQRRVADEVIVDAEREAKNHRGDERWHDPDRDIAETLLIGR